MQTERVRLGTLVNASTFRLPGQLAVEVATVDQMSGGRAELGIGAAWYEREHQYFGIPFPPLGERFDKLEEQLAILTGIWDTKPGERFSFDGKHYQVKDCASIPRWASRPKIIVGGAGAKRTPTLAARYADEFNGALGLDLRERYANFRRICEDVVGRDPAEVRLSATVPVAIGRDAADLERRKESLGEPGARLLAAGVTGYAGDVIRVDRGPGRPGRGHRLLPRLRPVRRRAHRAAGGAGGQPVLVPVRAPRRRWPSAERAAARRPRRPGSVAIVARPPYNVVCLHKWPRRKGWCCQADARRHPLRQHEECEKIARTGCSPLWAATNSAASSASRVTA